MKTKTFLGLLLTVVCAAACKKERSCECISSSSVTNSDGTQVYYMTGYRDSIVSNTHYTKISKRLAEEKCKSWERQVVETYTTSAGTVTQTISSKNTCNLK